MSLCFARAVSVILSSLCFLFSTWCSCALFAECAVIYPPLIFALADFPVLLAWPRAPALRSACLARCVPVLFRLKGKPRRDPRSALMQYRQICVRPSSPFKVALTAYMSLLFFPLVEAVQG